MKKPSFKTPSPSDLIGLPPGKFLVHEFPEDIQACETLSVTLNDINKQLINFSGEQIKPDRSPKKASKKTRYTEITLQFPQKIKAMKLFLEMNSKTVLVLGKIDSPIIMKPEILNPTETQVVTYYEKKRKRKNLNACFFGPGHAVIDIHRAMADCEVIIAVDTNYQINAPGITGKIAATTAIEAYFSIITDEACHVESGPMRQKITIDPPGNNPEIYGIGIMMFHFFEENPELRDKPIGIVTDTDLDLIKNINQRAIPFFDTMLLPENTTLFYATADSGSTEFMPNKLIRMCDNASNEFLKKYLHEKSGG